MKRVLFAAALLAASAPGIASGETPDGGSEIEPAEAVRIDADHDRITERLRRAIDEGSGDRVQVVAVFDSDADLDAARDLLTPAASSKRLGLIPALSATLLPDEITALAAGNGVHRIDVQPVYSAANDVANDDFGTALARSTYGVDGTGVGICIIDTGLDPDHEQFDDIGKIAAWFDAITGQPLPYDNHGHGSHVAGTAAGTGTGGADAATYRGVAPGADLYIAKGLNGSGFSVGTSVEDSLTWCVAQAGVDIISMSLGDEAPSDGLDALSLMVNAAVDAGKVVVVAAGNAGDDLMSVSTPAAAEKAITVGAVAKHSGSPSDPNHTAGPFLAPFSSRGPTLAPTSLVKPDISAPGVNIRSATANTTSGYEENNGTSMATPFVSGTVALMLEADPTLTPAQVLSILAATAIDRGPAGKDNDWGWGLIDGFAAVSEASSAAGYTPTSFPSYTHISGSVGTFGLWQHDFELGSADLTTPIAATILLEGEVVCVIPLGPLGCFAFAWTPDLDANLRDPSGTIIASSTCPVPVEPIPGCGFWGRQETLAAMPTTPGTYTIEVFPWGGGDGTGGPFEVYLSRADLGPSPFELDKSPDIQTLPEDGLVTFTISVKNVGETDIRQTTVTDPTTPDCTRSATEVRGLSNSKGSTVGFLLKPGESFTYLCSASSITETFDNTATVTGMVDVVTFNDMDTAHVVTENPGITVDKSPDVQTLPAGGTVTFTITVKNTGGVDLRKTAVSDTATPDCDRSFTQVRALNNSKGNPVGFLLKPNESFTYTCVATSVSAPFVNTAAAQGIADGVSIQHSDTALVADVDPGIDIEKTPASQEATAGSDVTFTITVTNTTDVDIRKTTVYDEATPACARTPTQVRALLNGGGQTVGYLLKPGETFTYTCVATAVTPPFSNHAAAQGIAEGVSIQDTDTATVTEPPPP